MNSSRDPDTLRTLYVGVLSVILVFVVIVVLQAVFYAAQEAEVARKAGTAVSDELAILRAEQRELLTSYRWLDRSRGVVAIPIDRAMELTIGELAVDTLRHDGGERITAQ